MSQATAGLSDTPRARAPALLRPAVSPASRRARDARVSAAAPAPGALPRGPFGPSQCLPCSAASAQPRSLGQGLAHGTCSILRVNDSFFEKKELLLVKQETFLQFHINSLDENRLLWCPLRPSPRPPQGHLGPAEAGRHCEHRNGTARARTATESVVRRSRNGRPGLGTADRTRVAAARARRVVSAHGRPQRGRNHQATHQLTAHLECSKRQHFHGVGLNGAHVFWHQNDKG